MPSRSGPRGGVAVAEFSAQGVGPARPAARPRDRHRHVGRDRQPAPYGGRRPRRPRSGRRRALVRQRPGPRRRRRHLRRAHRGPGDRRGEPTRAARPPRCLPRGDPDPGPPGGPGRLGRVPPMDPVDRRPRLRGLAAPPTPSAWAVSSRRPPSATSSPASAAPCGSAEPPPPYPLIRGNRGRRPLAGRVAHRPAPRPGPSRERRPAQRRRPLPLLAARSGRRRPRQTPARLPRGHRELAARPQYRHGRPQRQRVSRRRGAHRRQPPLEPARRDGHRSLPARAAPPRRSRIRRLGPRRRACPSSASTTCPARGRWRACILPRRCALLFGQEGPGLSDAARAACDRLFSIAQYGSTRSINAGVASGIAMHAWIREHAEPPPTTVTDIGRFA